VVQPVELQNDAADEADDNAPRLRVRKQVASARRGVNDELVERAREQDGLRAEQAGDEGVGDPVHLVIPPVRKVVGAKLLERPFSAAHKQPHADDDGDEHGHVAEEQGRKVQLEERVRGAD